MVFSDYRVSPNFLLCCSWVVVEVGLGCDNNFSKIVELSASLVLASKFSYMMYSHFPQLSLQCFQQKTFHPHDEIYNQISQTDRKLRQFLHLYVNSLVISLSGKNFHGVSKL